jgi:hypothetical protein
MESNLLGTINPGEHSRGHSGIILVGRGTDESDFMPALNILLQSQQRGEMSMTAPDKDQMFPHIETLTNISAFILSLTPLPV